MIDVIGLKLRLINFVDTRYTPKTQIESKRLRACSHDPGTTHCPGATH